MYNTTNVDESTFERGLYQFQSNGIHAIKGPNWEEELNKICKIFDGDICDTYTEFTKKEHYPGGGFQSTSVSNMLYSWHNGFMDRFQ